MSMPPTALFAMATTHAACSETFDDAMCLSKAFKIPSDINFFLDSATNVSGPMIVTWHTCSDTIGYNDCKHLLDRNDINIR